MPAHSTGSWKNSRKRGSQSHLNRRRRPKKSRWYIKTPNSKNCKCAKKKEAEYNKIVEKKLIEIANDELGKHKKLAKSQERHADVSATTSQRYGDPQSAAKMTKRGDQRTQNAVKKTMKALRNEEGIQAAQEKENREASSIASPLTQHSKHQKEEGREEKERQEKLQVKLRLKQLLENKKEEIETDGMPDNKKMDIPEELENLYNMAIWYEVIDEQKKKQMYEIVFQPKNIVLRDGSVHSWY